MKFLTPKESELIREDLRYFAQINYKKYFHKPMHHERHEPSEQLVANVIPNINIMVHHYIPALGFFDTVKCVNDAIKKLYDR